MTDKPYRIWVDSEPVFGPTSGHWGPSFSLQGDAEVYIRERIKRIRNGIALVVIHTPSGREVSRTSVTP